MKQPGLNIIWAGEVLTLLPERAIWWARQKALFIADPHFGKASTFRFAGVPIPEQTHNEDLQRLTKLLEHFPVKQLIILGDFFHARIGRSETTLTALAAWRARHADVEIILTLGNHDRPSGAPPAEWEVKCFKDTWPLAPFLCRHDPIKTDGAFTLAGHWHPAFYLQDRSGSGLRLPCFYFSENLAVLPAFGSFTGAHVIERTTDDRIFLVGPDEVIEFGGKKRG